MMPTRVGLILDERSWTGRLDPALRTAAAWVRCLGRHGLDGVPIRPETDAGLEAMLDCGALVVACDGVYVERGNGLVLLALAEYVRAGGILLEPLGSPFLFAETAHGLVPRLDHYAALFELTLGYVEEDRRLMVTERGRALAAMTPRRLSELTYRAVRPLCLHPAVNPDTAWIVTDTGEAVLAEHAFGSGSLIRWSAGACGAGGELACEALVRIAAERLRRRSAVPRQTAPAVLVDPIADPPDRLTVVVAEGRAPLRVRVEDGDRSCSAYDVVTAGRSDLQLPGPLTEPVDVVVESPSATAATTFTCQPEPTAVIRPLRGAPPGRPADFEAFWRRALDDLASIPRNLEWGEVEIDRHRGLTSARLSFASVNLLRVDALLCAPLGARAALPGVLALPGYGSGAAAASPEEIAERGFAVLAISLRGVGTRARTPRLESGGLLSHRLDRPESYGYRGAILDCVRAVDVLATAPQVDAERLATWGVSQGGGLALITAALDPRVRTVVAQVPFLCDLVRASAMVDTDPLCELRRWMASRADGEQLALARLGYFDVAGFAADIRARTLITRSRRDDIAPSAALDVVIQRMVEAPTVWEHDEGHLAPALLVHRAACLEWLAAQLAGGGAHPPHALTGRP